MSSNIDFYDAFASRYETYYAHIDESESVRRWIDFLEKERLIPTLEQRSIARPLLLDIGCGPGWHLRPWQGSSFVVSGLDSSPAMLRLAANNANAGLKTGICLYCADITKPECFASIKGKFRVLVGHFNFLNLFNKDQISSLFASLKILMQPDGIFITDMTPSAAFAFPNEYGQQESFCEWNRIVECNEKGTIIVKWRKDDKEFIENFSEHSIEYLSKISKANGIQLIRNVEWLPDEYQENKGFERILLVFERILR